MPLKRVIGKTCKNQNYEGKGARCPEYGAPRDANVSSCEVCGLELTPITKPNTGAVIGLAAALMLLVGGVTYLAASQFTGGLGWFSSGGSHSSKQDLAVRYALENDADGHPQVVSSDHVFRSGERFRLLLKAAGKASVLYVFYEDREQGKVQLIYPEGRLQMVESGEVTSVPSTDGDWIHMDENPGTENFIILASAKPLEVFPADSKSFTRDEFEKALQAIRKSQGLTEAKPAAGPEWVEAKSEKGVLLARFAVHHQ